MAKVCSETSEVDFNFSLWDFFAPGCGPHAALCGASNRIVDSEPWPPYSVDTLRLPETPHPAQELPFAQSRTAGLPPVDAASNPAAHGAGTLPAAPGLFPAPGAF